MTGDECHVLLRSGSFDLTDKKTIQLVLDVDYKCLAGDVNEL